MTLRTVIGLLALGATAWVGNDADRRDFSGDGFANRTWKWVVGCLLLWFVVFPIYLVRRKRAPLKPGGVTYARRVPLFGLGLAAAVAIGVGALGPWASAFGRSINGFDGTDAGFVVLVLALMILLCVVGVHRTRILFVVELLAAAFALGVYRGERHDVLSVGGPSGERLLHVGWGLDLILVGAVVAIVHSLAAVLGFARRAAVPASAPAPLPGGPIFRPDTAEAPPEEQHAPPPGWYLDPSNAARLRYWNGEGWESTTAAVEPGPAMP